MGRRRKSKKPRGSRGVRQAPCMHDTVAHPYHDLFVPLPKASSAAENQLQSQLLLRQVLDRLAFTGYSTAAITHIVYGRPKLESDASKNVFGRFSFEHGSGRGAEEAVKRTGKRQRTEPSTTAKESPPQIKILKRLHAVVENLSDVAAYTLPPKEEAATIDSISAGPLDGYDLVSISPRNDVTFQAACASATAAKIVTLDYTSGRGGVQLPFRIRSVEIKALVQRDAVIELPYAPALLHPNKRKALVQTARELQMACVGVHPKPRIIFGSGDRTVEEIDTGAMALRTPGDMINLLQTVLRFSQPVSYDALSASGTALLNPAKQANVDGVETDVVVEVFLEREETSSDVAAAQEKAVEPEEASESLHNTKQPPDHCDDSDGNEEAEDGFITLT